MVCESYILARIVLGTECCVTTVLLRFAVETKDYAVHVTDLFRT